MGSSGPLLEKVVVQCWADRHLGVCKLVKVYLLPSHLEAQRFSESGVEVWRQTSMPRLVVSICFCLKPDVGPYKVWVHLTGYHCTLLSAAVGMVYASTD